MLPVAEGQNPLGSNRRAFEPGQVIVRDGELVGCLFVVREGRVKVSAIIGGVTTPLDILGPGDFFGEASVFARQPAVGTFEAIDKVQVIAVEPEVLETLVVENAEIACRIIVSLAERLAAKDAFANVLRHRDVKARVLHGLMWRASSSASNTLAVNAELAAHLGLQTAQVDRVLDPLDRLGLVARKDGTVSVKDINKLQEFTKLMDMTESSTSESR